MAPRPNGATADASPAPTHTEMPSGQPSASSAVMPFLRLSNAEYTATVTDLMGGGSVPAAPFPVDSEISSGYLGAGPTETNVIRAYQQAAESLAVDAVTHLDKLVACTPTPATEDGCADKVINDFGKRAFRRPLTDGDKADLKDLYTLARSTMGYSYQDGIRLVITAMLQSPFFVYHWELGATTAHKGADGFIKLGSYEIASRLSYFFWGSMPDATLFAAADDGSLSNPAEITRQARRLLADKRAAGQINTFTQQWLDIASVGAVSKNPTAYPDFNAALAQAMTDESTQFVASVFQGDGKLDTLLNGRSTFINDVLGKVYGLAGGAKGATLTPASLDATQRAGILTRASFLTVHGATNGSNPVTRGKAIYTRLMCGEIAPPPMGVPDVKPPATDVTTRQRYAEHAQVEPCASCHKLFDDYGFGLENYDGVGRYRSKEGALDVDGSGTITLKSGKKSFSNGVEMSAVLAGADEVRSCVATQWIRFILGRREVDDDQASIDSALKTFAAAGYDMRELMVALTQTRSFLTRAPGNGEVTQ